MKTICVHCRQVPLVYTHAIIIVGNFEGWGGVWGDRRGGGGGETLLWNAKPIL